MEIKNIVARQREFFNHQNTKTYDFRKKALSDLAIVIKDHEKQIMEALWKDLHKSEFESYVTEIGFVLKEIQHATKNLHKWMRPKSKRTPLMLFGSRSKVICEPYGVALILAPWNYPFQLLISPLIGAIVAGNCALLKPSRQAPNVATVIGTIIDKAFEPGHVAMVDIPNEEMDELLGERFDYIFYTGGVNYGKHIMRMAAQNLTPVTLELGGKSPCIVDLDANLKIAARRIVWGKFLNAGQTCVAPDYLIVHKDIKDRFVALIMQEIENQYGSNPKQSTDYVRIISRDHCMRLASLLKYGTIVGGESEIDVDQKYIAPTLLLDVDMESELMSEEIFGPLLPILEFSDISEAISLINSHQKPLALYCFTDSHKQANRVINETSSGGVCVNDVVVHVANTHIPFGGLGNSGMGNYHGLYSFITFSHQRSVLSTQTRFDIKLKFAPYKSKIKLLRKFM